MLTSNNPFDEGASTGAGVVAPGQTQPPPSFLQPTTTTATTNATATPFADKSAVNEARVDTVIGYDKNNNNNNNNNNNSSSNQSNNNSSINTNIPSTGGSNVLNVSVSTSLYPSSEERQVLAKFRVDVAFKGKQVLRPITYFPIYTEILMDNDATISIPELPASAPHLRGLSTGVKRNDWTRGTCAMVERRYSEVVDLRELLVFQFPTLIIPPLPAKNSVRDLETFLNAGDAIAIQRFNLQFFLKEIAAMPAVMFFSEWTAPFFLDPRDSFETSTLLRMRATLRAFRTVNAPFIEHSQRHRSFANDTANMITSTSTKLIRSVANLFRSSSSTNYTSTNAMAGAGNYGNRIGETNTVNSSSTDHEVVNPQAYNFGMLPPSLQEHTAYWIKTMEQLEARRVALKKTAKTFENLLSALVAQNKSLSKVSESIEEYASTLKESECLSKESENFHLVVLALDESAAKEREFSDGKYLNVCLRLNYECNLISSALDAMDYVLCLFQSLSLSHSYDVRDTFFTESANFAESVSKGLKTDYTSRYQKFYTIRMKNLLLTQIVQPSSECANKVYETISHSPFYSTIHAPAFAQYNNNNGNDNNNINNNYTNNATSGIVSGAQIGG